MRHDVDMAAAYALDALDPGERAEFETHLAGCNQCRAEVIELRRVVDVLPLAVEPVEPPAALRQRILEAAQDVPDEGWRPDVMVGGKPVPARNRRRLPATLLAIAAALVIAGLGIRDIELQGAQNQQQSLQRQVVAALARGAVVSHVGGTAAAPNASASLVQSSRHTYLVVHGLQPSPASKVYQVWYVRGSQVRSAGTFTYSRASQIVPLPPAAGYVAAAVTMEPGPHGSKAPTGPKVLLGTMRA